MNAIPTPSPMQDDPLAGRKAEIMVRLIESSVLVNRRYQFFVWTQSYLQELIPHKLMVCGAYQRPRRDVVFEALHSIPVPQPVLSVMTDGASPLMQQIVGAWLNNRGRALLLNLAALDGLAAGVERDRLAAAGVHDVLVHGTSRPQRAAELETFFVMATLQPTAGPRNAQPSCNSQHRLHMDLLMPHLHATYQRVVSTERELSTTPAVTAVARTTDARGIITDREKQILSWVREGKSNQEIGVVLDISALTVKNHVQKILRKLDASNRAQAVAKAMVLNLLGSPAGDSEHSHPA
jgi:transcriptional regulator EpsA